MMRYVLNSVVLDRSVITAASSNQSPATAWHKAGNQPGSQTCYIEWTPWIQLKVHHPISPQPQPDIRHVYSTLYVWHGMGFAGHKPELVINSVVKPAVLTENHEYTAIEIPHDMGDFERQTHCINSLRPGDAICSPRCNYSQTIQSVPSPSLT